MLVCGRSGVLPRHLGMHGQRSLLQPNCEHIRAIQLYGQGLAISRLPVKPVHGYVIIAIETEDH